ncbi:MAG: CDP-glucose 4,6-dehydratase [Planctomycetaceae bacterium]|nr:CDP-glucose 4,6-dehydratase [Planctomycetaceae bacterium]
MSCSFASSFRGRNVFVTGHTGFKGSWLALWLERLGARVTGYSLAPTTETNNFELTSLADRIAAHHLNDVRDGRALEAALRQAQPDVVFHLAAQPLVRAGYDFPHETFETNVMGTTNLLEALRVIGKPCSVVIVTTDKCYENAEQVWGYRETDRLGGHDPYSASKAAAEIVASCYRSAYFARESAEDHGIRVATARAGNVIGGGDWSKDRLITELVRCIRCGESVSLRYPKAVRPWQHVLEPLSGYLHLAGRLLEDGDPALCNAWNFGPIPGEELRVDEISDMFIDLWGKGHWRDTSSSFHPHETGVLRLCIDKAVWQLGWRPRWHMPDAIARCVRWFKNHYSGGDAAEECYTDIADYERAHAVDVAPADPLPRVHRPSARVA